VVGYAFVLFFALATLALGAARRYAVDRERVVEAGAVPTSRPVRLQEEA
jgi:hypothetical protein